MKHIRYIGDPPQNEDDYRTFPDSTADELVKMGSYEYYTGKLRDGDSPNDGTKQSKADARVEAPPPQIQGVGTTIAEEAPQAPPMATAEQIVTES